MTITKQDRLGVVFFVFVVSSWSAEGRITVNVVTTQGWRLKRKVTGLLPGAPLITASIVPSPVRM